MPSRFGGTPIQKGVSRFGGTPVSTDENRDTTGLQQQRLDELPEIGSGGLLHGEDKLNIAAIAPALLTATKPEEMAEILTSSFPNVGVSMSPPDEENPGGRLVAVNNDTGAAVELNKPGLSKIDIAQFLGLAAAFTPAGRAATLGTQGVGRLAAKQLAQRVGQGALASGATQAGIEGVQALSGGSADASDIGLATALGGAGETILPAGRSAIGAIKKALPGKTAPLTQAAREPIQSTYSSGVIQHSQPKQAFTSQYSKQFGSEPYFKGAAADQVENVQEAIAGAAASGKSKPLEVIARIDRSVVRDAKALGVDLNPDHYASNQQFVEVMQGIKSKPGSILGERESRAIETLGARGADLIEDMKGQTDKAGLSTEFRATMKGVIEDLQTSSNDLYKKGNDLINPKTKLARENLSIVKFLDGEASNLSGGHAQLSPIMKKVNDMLSDVSGPPTYTNLDKARKMVGHGLKNPNAFPDAQAGELKALYSRLAEDQQRIASLISPEGGSFIRSGSDLIIERKGIEDGLVDLLGRNLQKDLMPAVSGSLRSLSKGNVEQWRRTVMSIPENFRGRAVASALHDMFTAGSRTKGGNLGQGFVNMYEGFNKNPTAKRAFFAELPPIAEKRADAIFNVARGIYKAKKFENTSGTTRALLASMDKNLGAIGKIYKATKIGLQRTPGARLFEDMLPDLTPASKKADRFLSSGAFKKALETSLRGNNEKANKMIGGKFYNEWLKATGDETKATIAKVGFFQWLSQQEDEAQ